MREAGQLAWHPCAIRCTYEHETPPPVTGAGGRSARYRLARPDMTRPRAVAWQLSRLQERCRALSEANTSIGARLRQLRRDAMLTQEELAERAGVSKDLIAKLEQGARRSARLISFVRLAAALDVELSELLGKRPQLDGHRDDASVLAVRDVLLSPSLLPGLEPADAEPAPMAELQRAVTAAGRAYWAGKFAELTAVLPPLIGEARATRASIGPTAATPLALAYELAPSLMVHMGKADLAAVG